MRMVIKCTHGRNDHKIHRETEIETQRVRDNKPHSSLDIPRTEKQSWLRFLSQVDSKAIIKGRQNTYRLNERRVISEIILR